MSRNQSSTKYRNLRGAGSILGRSARSLTYLLILSGFWSFLTTIRPLLPDSPEQLTWGERRLMGVVALVTLGGFGLAAWVVGRLLRTGAELIDALIDGVEANVRTAELIELHMIPALNRIAGALESAPTAPRDDAQTRAAEAVRQAIATGRWARAERLIAAFARDYPEAPVGERLADALEAGRRAVIDDLRAQLNDARDAGNSEAVIDARDALTEHLRGAALLELDREVVRWLYGQIQSRARSGTLRDDVALLAGRVADSFGDTPEGVKIRAALPELRRSAGLCPRCARPYRGRADACPQCMRSPQPESEAIP